MPSITPHTVAELIYWSYANLAMAHDGINRGLPTYDKTSFIIRMRMYKGLLSGKLQVCSLFKDERWNIYDERRRTELPKHGIKLVVISYSDFGTSKKLVRNRDADLEVVKTILERKGVIL